MEHGDVGVGERRAAAHDEPVIEPHVALRVPRRVVDEDEMRGMRRRVARDGLRHRNEARVVVGGVDVRAQREEGLRTQQVASPRDGAGGLERLGLARPEDVQAETRPAPHARLDPLAKMRDVDHHLADARRREALELANDEGLPPHFEECLGRALGQGPHALAAAGGEEDRAHRAALRTCSPRGLRRPRRARAGGPAARAPGSARTCGACRRGSEACPRRSPSWRRGGEGGRRCRRP